MLDLRPLNERIYQILLDRILSGELNARQRLDVKQLSQELGVSRTPVMDAFKQLAAEGLVEISPRRGTRVAMPSLRDVEELFDLAKMVELHAAEPALNNATAEDRERLWEMVEGLDVFIRDDGYTDYRAFLHENTAMHAYIVGLAGNRRLSDFYESINIHTQLAFLAHFVRVHGGYEVGEAQATHREHLNIVTAFEEGALDALRAACAEHIGNSLSRFRQTLDKLRSGS